MKNVVFVGYGPSAVQAAKDLATSLPADFRIVAITSAEGYWPVASLRASVVPVCAISDDVRAYEESLTEHCLWQGWEDKPVASVDAAFPQDDRHVMLKTTNVVELRKDSVVVDKAHPDLGFEGTEIPFEYCVLATVRIRAAPRIRMCSAAEVVLQGSKYPYPCRPHSGSSFTQTIEDLRATQLEVSRARHILVIGGGPVGIEFAGEVAAHYDGRHGREKKQITVVHSRERLLDQPGWKEKLGKSLKQQLESYGVEVVLGKKVTDAPEQTRRTEGEKEYHLDDGQTVKGACGLCLLQKA